MASEFMERQKGDFFRDMTSFGSLWWYFIFMLVFLISEKYAVFKESAMGLVIIYVIVVLIRTFYFKDRPKKYSYGNYIERLDASSFPSLHSSRATFLAMILIKFFNNIFMSAFLVLLAIIVYYSRIRLKKHDFKDVLWGVVVGLIVYLIISYLLGIL